MKVSTILLRTGFVAIADIFCDGSRGKGHQEILHVVALSTRLAIYIHAGLINCCSGERPKIAYSRGEYTTIPRTAQKGHSQHPTTRAAPARLGGAPPESSNDCTRRETNLHISQATILWGAVTWLNQIPVCDSQNLHYAYRLPRLEIISLGNHP